MAPRAKRSAQRITNARLSVGVPQVPPPPIPQPPEMIREQARTAPRNQHTATIFPRPEDWQSYNRMKTRKAIVERPINTEEVAMMYLNRNHWETFMTPTVPPNISLVREFYANLAGSGGDYVYVRGRHVDISLAAIRVALDLLDVTIDHEQAMLALFNGDQDQFLNNMLTTLCDKEDNEDINAVWVNDLEHNIPSYFEERFLAMRFKALHRFIITNLLPTTYIMKVTYEQALILYAIQTSTPIDVARILRSRIERCINNPKVKGWYFPILITKLCMRAGVEAFDSDIMEEIPRPYTIQAMGRPAPPRERATQAMRQRDFNRAQKHMMDYMHSSFQRLEAQIRHVHETPQCDPEECELPIDPFPHPYNDLNP